MVGERARLQRGFKKKLKLSSIIWRGKEKRKKNERGKKRQLGASQVMLVVKNPGRKVGDAKQLLRGLDLIRRKEGKKMLQSGNSWNKNVGGWGQRVGMG